MNKACSRCPSMKLIDLHGKRNVYGNKQIRFSLFGQGQRILQEHYMTANKDPEVLIVGAGPTGLLLACGLIRRGVTFRIIDKKQGLSTHVKASEVTPASLEIFEDYDIINEALRLGVSVSSFKMFAHGKQVWRGQYGEIDSPYKYQLHLGQPYTEKLLSGFLEKQGGKIEWKTRLVSFKDTGGDVETVIQSQQGSQEVIRSTYLCACDGASSRIRELLGLKFEGHTYPADNLIGNVKMDWDQPADVVYVFFSPAGEMTVSPLPDGFHQINGSFRLAKGSPSRKGQPASLADLQSMFDERSHIPARLSKPDRLSYYLNHHRTVSKQKIGRTFLLGDAAHIVSPNTGLGMNTGLQDANNLAWKLHLVLTKKGRESLLETYHEERHSVLKGLGQLSDSDEWLYLLQNKVAREVRNHVVTFLMRMDPVFIRQNAAIAQTNIHYRKSSLVRQEMALPLHPPGRDHLVEHGSCPAAWFTFGEGPHAGDRASDVRPVTDPGTEDCRIFDRLTQGKHTLLVFVGCAEPGKELKEEFNRISEGIQGSYANWIKIFWVISGYSIPKNLPGNGTALRDEKELAHRRYGAQAECMYLIRPDKFIGFRSLPPNWEKLNTYLKEKIFKQ